MKFFISSIFSSSLVILFLFFFSSDCLQNESRIQCKADDVHIGMRECWPLKSNVTCRWCSKECFKGAPCSGRATCCIKECGYACSPPQPPTTTTMERGIVCSNYLEMINIRPRVGCPWIEKNDRCFNCDHWCSDDNQCKHGFFCCQTACGRRCVEPISM